MLGFIRLGTKLGQCGTKHDSAITQGGARFYYLGVALTYRPDHLRERCFLDIFAGHGASLGRNGGLIIGGSLLPPKERRQQTGVECTEYWVDLVQTVDSGGGVSLAAEMGGGRGAAKPGRTPKMARDVGKRIRGTVRV
jgi:hypothetical protein